MISVQCAFVDDFIMFAGGEDACHSRNASRGHIFGTMGLSPAICQLTTRYFPTGEGE